LSKKKATRIIAWILAVLMIISAGALIINFAVNAEEISADSVQVTENDNIGGEPISADVQSDSSYDEFLPHIDVCQTPVRVGVFYIYSTNNCLAFSHNILSENGLIFYSKNGDEYSFFHKSEKPVTVLRDFSAAKNSSGKYYFTTDGNTHIIYHCITAEPVEKSILDKTIEDYKELLPEGTAVFPFYMGGNPHIAVGTYKDKEASESDCGNMTSLLGAEFVARTPNNTCVSVIETDSGKILFKIDTVDCRLFVRPIQTDGEDEYYIKSSVGNIFDGTFEYKATIDGLYLVNILDMEDYIKSVLPYEISSSWPVETLRAFSIVVRSYTLSNLSNNHKNQDFDMCDETHCQAYRGRLRSTKTTDEAVEFTRNLVVAYDSKICKTFYHAVAGGMTESSENAWYSAYDYLVPVELPFENYGSHTYGKWSFTVSEKELFEYLEKNSSVAKKIDSSIVSVRISEYTPSGYAYKLEIIDKNGNVAVFEKTDVVRGILSKYCKSPRMSIGKVADVTVNDSERVLDVTGFFQTDPDGNPIRFNATSDSAEPVYKKVLTADGEYTLTPPETDTLTISGTGWGHGVGMSQYGARDMALLGYTWEEIATYFFTNSYIANLNDLSIPYDEYVPESGGEEPSDPSDSTDDVKPSEPVEGEDVEKPETEPPEDTDDTEDSEEGNKKPSGKKPSSLGSLFT